MVLLHLNSLISANIKDIKVTKLQIKTSTNETISS